MRGVGASGTGVAGAEGAAGRWRAAGLALWPEFHAGQLEALKISIAVSELQAESVGMAGNQPIHFARPAALPFPFGKQRRGVKRGFLVERKHFDLFQEALEEFPIAFFEGGCGHEYAAFKFEQGNCRDAEFFRCVLVNPGHDSTILGCVFNADAGIEQVNHPRFVRSLAAL